MLLLPLRTLALTFFCLGAVTADTVVHLGYASYRGTALPNGISQWLGMRYAAPPVGNLRFAAPQDPPVMPGIQDATTHGPLCISTSEYPIPSGQSEDCLFLDVYAPTNVTSLTKLPVFFWIQGGGFNADSNANYNGTGLIEASGMNIVVVTFNYRVGPYGFLAGKEVQEGGSLNNGLKDQIKALQWVQQYISQFGGDPGHVVVGGDSAGAASITLLLSAYGGDGQLANLFHATAAESQSFGTILTVEESQFAYDNLTLRTGCADSADSLACLRSLDVATLQQQNFNIPFPGAQIPPLFMYSPTIDGELVPDYTDRLFQQGRFLKVPVIFGDDTNEGTIWVPQSTSSVAEADTFIQAQFPFITPQQLARINALYMEGNNSQTSYPGAGPYWQSASNAYGEMRYICPGIFVSSAFSQYGESTNSNWNYHYAVEDPAAEQSGYGVQHTVEVNAIWGPQYVSSPAPASYFTTNAPIVPVMQAYWTSFIRSFNPNTYRYPGSPEWIPWGGSPGENGDGYNRLFIQTGNTTMETVPLDQRYRCAYLASIGLDLRQ
ncbi:hypothetical protein VTN77DRAFT_4907 [Rasamsonia byssochlamydoides]|uniref:uncharacterized protein n=1 Tax=Rasamsonia byssochlamydoides TaxID=89139 RepID=UPI00374486D8